MGAGVLQWAILTFNGPEPQLENRDSAQEQNEGQGGTKWNNCVWDIFDPQDMGYVGG